MIDSIINKLFASTFSKEQISSHYEYLFSSVPSSTLLEAGFSFSEKNKEATLSEICNYINKFDYFYQAKIKASKLFKDKYNREPSDKEKNNINDSLKEKSNSSDLLNLSLLMFIISNSYSDSTDTVSLSTEDLSESYLSDSFYSDKNLSSSSNNKESTDSGSAIGSGCSGSGCSGSGSGSGSGCSGSGCSGCGA